MAVAVSGFHTTRLSLDDHQSSHPSSPLIFNPNFRSTLPQWIDCLSRGSDRPQPERNNVKSPIVADRSTICSIRPVSQLIPCNTIRPTSSAIVDEESDPCNNQKTRSTLQRWLGSLQRRARQRSAEDIANVNRVLPWVWALENEARSSSSILPTHRKSLSDSSFRFVSAVRSASTSFAGSGTETALSQCQSQVDFEAETFQVPNRGFDDETMTSSPQQVDCASVQRAIRRRKILHELIYTEKNYLGDIRFLLNVYVTMLASLPSSHSGLRRSVNQNLCEILQLHEEILSELGRAILQSHDEELDQSCSPQIAIPILDQREWSGDGELACYGIEHASHIDQPTESLAGPQTVAEVSRVFEKKMSRFFIYEEYGAKYDMILQDIASVDQVLPGWECNQRGLEALSVLLHSYNVPDCHSRRASTLKDLLVKPIQRICKYPLIFEELLKYTPALDCPDAHMATSSVLSRFREANFEINRVTNDPYMTRILTRTWLLQDRLVFPNMNFDSVSKDRVRSLGHIRLCGPTEARLSTRRATTSCPKPPLYQVILKNTSEHTPSYACNATSLSISRSHSLLSSRTRSRVSILSPPKMERARLETLLADVWSREILPFPGIPTRVRNEKFVRTSASTVMRKLSVMSIANSLARRTEGLRQRLSLEDPRRPDTTEMMAFRDKWHPSGPTDVSDKICGLKESRARAMPTTRSSWSHDRRDVGSKKVNEATSLAAGSWGPSCRKIR
ncbi:hypothetical protein E4U21_005143 [Claviceps maximensis]|nr:hypothetical protein E4U21_005143 [Claviceps maximensis]